MQTLVNFKEKAGDGRVGNDPSKLREVEVNDLGSISAFEGPFQLATVLLDLLESSFCSHHSYQHTAEPSSPIDGDSPMSVAIQLVTAITALQQTKSKLF